MSPRKKTLCPGCGGIMCLGSNGCVGCSRGGRPPHPDNAYAAELGVSVRHLRRIGGAAAVRAMHPEIRALMLKPFRYGNSRTVHRGGLRARGMFTRTPARLTQPQP